MKIFTRFDATFFLLCLVLGASGIVVTFTTPARAQFINGQPIGGNGTGNVTGGGLTNKAMILGGGGNALTVGPLPGTAGNVVTSDGANWISSPAGSGSGNVVAVSSLTNGYVPIGNGTVGLTPSIIQANATTVTIGAAGAGNIIANVITSNNATYAELTVTGNVNLPAPINGATGGTGVANTGKTITLGGNLTTTGAFATNIIVSAATNAALPAGTVSLGYINIPQNSNSANYTTVAADVGKMILHPTADNNARTFTINNTAHADGDVISILNQINTLTVSLSSGNLTLYQGNLSATGANATVPAGSVATVYRIATGVWMIAGAGVTVP